MRIYEAVFLGDAENTANKHLLQHYRANELQEDLCFALWRPSTGKVRYTGIIYKIILPEIGDRDLHGNVEFAPRFLSKAVNLAIQEKAGLAFIHSHPTNGWQGMSVPDIVAERDVLAPPALATGLPLLGLTVGTDGYWSARFWKQDKKKIQHFWCQKIRVVDEKTYNIFCNDNLIPPPKRKNILKRTFETWGKEHQNNIARLKIGIVGLGSVGCIVAEAIARIGINHVVLIDPDRVEEHNLDRLLYGTSDDIGRYKVDVAYQLIKKHTSADKVDIKSIPISIQYEQAYHAALDCDFLFSCVDRPLARDILNFIAFGHLIPVVDGGIQVLLDDRDYAFYNTHWRSHLVTPYHQCLRCNKQYSTSDVVSELDGSLDTPSYISSLPKDQRNSNQNVFPFSLSVASMGINMMIRYIISQAWWPEVQQQDYQFLTGSIKINNQKCSEHCLFQNDRVAMGDKCKPHYIVSQEDAKGQYNNLFLIYIRKSFHKIITKVFGKGSQKE